MKKISIITVCLNSEKSIENTLRSVLSQSYSNFEYIIKDGGSTDNTLSIIEYYKDFFKKKGIQLRIIVSKDEGIYDAMNQAVVVATGVWVNFMNSGDEFYSSETLSKVFLEKYYEAYDVIYGDTVSIFPWGNVLFKAHNIEKLKKKMIFCHQSCFVKSEMFNGNMFNVKYKICSDYDFFRKLFKDQRKFIHTSIVVSKYNGDEGISARSKLLVVKEMDLICERSIIISQIRMIWFVLIEWIKYSLIPLGFKLKLRRIYYKIQH